MDLWLNSETHEVFYKKHQQIDLSPIEFKLLSFLVSKPERVFSRSQMLDYVWGNNSFIEERTVDVHIRRLRQSLESIHYDSLIQTVRGVGYKLSKNHIRQ